jgi:hypothetical protein
VWLLLMTTGLVGTSLGIIIVSSISILFESE